MDASHMNGYAVVTGASRGIGRATALAFAKRGAAVVLLVRSKKEGESVARESMELGAPWAKAFLCDVANSRAVDRVADVVLKAHGPPKWIVNNAGIVRRSTVETTTDKDWNDVVSVNLSGPFFVTRVFLKAMRKAKRGRIVHVGSISSTLGTPKLSAYCASKWGLVGFMKSLAEELRGTGLQTMAVLPGSVDTDMLKGSGFPPEMTPDAVADAIVYAALDAPSAMNGSALEIFGP